MNCLLLIENQKLPSWNQFYSGMHWSNRKALAEQWHWIVREVAGNTSFEKPVDITVRVFVSHHPQDPDNLCDKLLIDGLVHANVLMSDDYGRVRSVTTMSLIDKKNPRIEVEISDVEDSN